MDQGRRSIVALVAMMDFAVPPPESTGSVPQLDPPALTGAWSNGARWSFRTSSSLPDRALITSIFCAAFTPDGVVLTITERGVEELLGGHIEPGESVEQTLTRESLEEGGIRLQIWAQAGLREIENDLGTLNKTTGLPYPARSFMPYYVGYSELPLLEPTGIEIRSRRVVPIAEALQLNLSVFPDRREFEILLRHLLELAGERLPQNFAALTPRSIQRSLHTLSTKMK